MDKDKSSRILHNDTGRKFYITEMNGDEREVSQERYIDFNKSDKEKIDEALKEQVKQVKEELRKDIDKFIGDVNRAADDIEDFKHTEGNKMAELIDTTALTNFLLWKMLGRNI